MELRGLTALAAALATGCLASPPGANVSGDAGGDSDGAACATTTELFDGDALGGLWDNPSLYGASSLDVAGGTLAMFASPDAEVVGIVELLGLEEQPLAGSLLTAELASFNSETGTTGFGWYHAMDDLLIVTHVAGAVRSRVVRPGGSDVTVCAPCASYVDGQPVTAEIREQDGMIHFAATVDGEDWDLGSTSGSAEDYRAYLFVYAPGLTDTAEIAVAEVSWTDCSSL